MTEEETQHVLEKAKANQFDEYGNYGENNGPLGKTTEMTKLEELKAAEAAYAEEVAAAYRDELNKQEENE